MKAKLTQTMYFDFYHEEWTDYKPEGAYTVDYDTLRKGTLPEVLTTPEELKEHGFQNTGYAVIAVHKYGYWLGFDSIEELKRFSVLKVRE